MKIDYKTQKNHEEYLLEGCKNKSCDNQAWSSRNHIGRPPAIAKDISLKEEMVVKKYQIPSVPT